MIYTDYDEWILDEDELEAEEGAAEPELPYRDWAIDFDTGKLATRGGRHYIVENEDALRVWIWKVLQTKQGVYPCYDDDFGSEMHALVGETDVEDMAAHAEFYLESALTVSPYIDAVRDVTVVRKLDRAIISFTVVTIWGDIEEETEVEYI